jgi:hypothetical protein
LAGVDETLELGLTAGVDETLELGLAAMGEDAGLVHPLDLGFLLVLMGVVVVGVVVMGVGGGSD